LADRLDVFPGTRGRPTSGIPPDETPILPGPDELTEPELSQIRTVLSRAVARVCPPWLSDRRDDLVQASLMRMMDICKKREGNHTFSASYLYKVAYSALVDEIRRVRRRREVPLEVGPEEERPAPEKAISDDDPEKRAMSREIGRGIQSCLGLMLAERRQAVALHLLGHSVPDAARILGWSSKRTENFVYRGLADLRRCLQSKGLEP
jgi:RNA polymerase sigma-70 factor, ECF subfamily